MRHLSIVALAALASAGLAFGAQAASKPAAGLIIMVKNGADDGAAHHAADKRGKAADGAKHTMLDMAPIVIARRAADDPAGHDANDDRGRGRHGGDDGAHHG